MTSSSESISCVSPSRLTKELDGQSLEKLFSTYSSAVDGSNSENTTTHIKLASNLQNASAHVYKTQILGRRGNARDILLCCFVRCFMPTLHSAGYHRRPHQYSPPPPAVRRRFLHPLQLRS